MLIDMVKYYKMVKDRNINIIYSGPIWSDGIEGIGGTLRKRLEFDDLPFSAAQSVFSVFVEQMNNMLMYSMEKEKYDDENDEISKGVFILGTKGKQYFIQTGNIIRTESAELIKQKIDYLNTLDKTELRKYYKQQLKEENTSPESKGAGLGLIEIARRASSKIEYEFVPFEDGNTFFIMFVTIC